MKHLSVKLPGTPEHDAKGVFAKVFNDRNGEALPLTDEEAQYWSDRILTLGGDAIICSEFKTWMTKVDEACIWISSVSVYDLTDQPFKDSFEAGLKPAEMAEMALKDNGWPG